MLERLQMDLGNMLRQKNVRWAKVRFAIKIPLMFDWRRMRTKKGWHKWHYFNPAGLINKNVNDIVNFGWFRSHPFFFCFLTPFLMSHFSLTTTEAPRHIFHSPRFFIEVQILNIICEWLPEMIAIFVFRWGCSQVAQKIDASRLKGPSRRGYNGRHILLVRQPCLNGNQVDSVKWLIMNCKCSVAQILASILTAAS